MGICLKYLQKQGIFMEERECESLGMDASRAGLKSESAFPLNYYSYSFKENDYVKPEVPVPDIP